jgi:hypothetical protein
MGHNPAYEVAQRDLEQFRHLTFDNFALSLRIRDVTVRKSGLELDDYPAIRLFTLEQGLAEQEIRVKLEEPKLGLDSEPKLSVWFRRKWRPLASLLQSLMVKVPAVPFSYTDLSEWWDANGKHFPFLQLPRELRNAIYVESMFLPGTKLVYPYQYSQTPGKGKSRTKARSPHNLNLLAKRRDPRLPFLIPNDTVLHHPRGFNTCTKGGGGTLQVYEEASQTFYSRAQFIFESAYHLEKFYARVRDKDWQMIRDMRINFSFPDLLGVLGANLGSGYNYQLQVAIEDLPTLRLRKLLVDIPSPRSLSRTDITLWEDGKGGCHTKVVQLVLDLLCPYVAHLSESQLQLTGYIKPAQKLRFMNSLERYETEPEACKLPIEEFQDKDTEGGVLLQGPHIEHYLQVSDWAQPRDLDLEETMMYDPEDEFPAFEL